MKYILIIATVFIAFNFGFAQDNPVVLISGTISKFDDGKPISSKVKFINSQGVVFEAKSNSDDGSYQQVLPVGEQYSLIVEGYLQSDHEFVLNLKNINMYSEMSRDIKVIALREGLELVSIDAFVDNDSKTHDSIKIYMNYLKHILTHQKGLHLELVVNSSDSYFKDKKVKKTFTEKGKNKTKTITLKNKDQLTDLLDLRVQAIKDLIKENKIQERNAVVSTDLVLTSAPKPVKKSKKSKTPTPPAKPVFDLTIKIAKVMKL